MADQVQIVQRNLDPRTQALQALTITVTYGDGIQADATILLKPGLVPNKDQNIRDEIVRLGFALQNAARSPNGVTSC